MRRAARWRRTPRTSARAGSSTETFVALRAEVQNWRWAGVPFYLRTGKRMDRRASEIVVVFKRPPHAMFPHSEGSHRAQPAAHPGPARRGHAAAHDGQGARPRRHPAAAGLAGPRATPTAFDQRSPDAYERLLMDVVRGNPTLFMRRDEVEAAWTWVEPILEPLVADADAAPALPGRHHRPHRRRHAARARRPNLAGDATMTTCRRPPEPSRPAPGRRRGHRRIVRRSAPGRAAYLARLRRRRPRSGPARGRLACANLAHGFAASERAGEGRPARPASSPTSRSCPPTTTCSRPTSRSRRTRRC